MRSFSFRAGGIGPKSCGEGVDQGVGLEAPDAPLGGIQFPHPIGGAGGGICPVAFVGLVGQRTGVGLHAVGPHAVDGMIGDGAA